MDYPVEKVDVMTVLVRNTFIYLLLNSITNTVLAADKVKVIKNIDNRFQAHHNIAIKIFNYAKLGYLENKSSALLKDPLRDAGFKIERSHGWRY